MKSLNIVLCVICVAIIYFLPVLGDYLYKKCKERYKRNIIYNENNKDLKFEKIYSKINNENIYRIEEEREKERKNEVSKNVRFLIAFLILIILNINFDTLFKSIPIKQYSSLKSITTASLLIVPLLWIATFARGINNKTKKYQKQYKELILADFINLYNKDYIYKLDIEDVEHLKLRNEYYENKFSIGRQGKFDLLNVQNCIYGKIDKTTQMSLYDISVELVNGAYSYIAEGKYSEFKQRYDGASVFKGTYIILDIDKKIPTFVRVTKNKYIPRKNKVELDSNEFEKYFDVNSEDKVLAVRILTAEVMEMLIDFYKKYNIKFEIVLKENKIYINLHTAEAFKISLYKGIDKERIYLYYAILEFTTNLSKEINKVLNEIEL